MSKLRFFILESKFKFKRFESQVKTKVNKLK